eukprot:14673956-Heterocapsa_arctica.AAC.2
MLHLMSVPTETLLVLEVDVEERLAAARSRTSSRSASSSPAVRRIKLADEKASVRVAISVA